MTETRARIGFIGGGNMARAIIGGLLKAGHAAGRILVADPDPAQRDRIRALDAAVETGADNAAVYGAAEVLVVAVKPQSVASALEPLGPLARAEGGLVLSIAAGVTLDKLNQLLPGSAAIVRAMPNQPALVGAGMTVLVATAGTSAKQRALAGYVASSTGRAEWIDDESLMDAVTAASGSGPAYFYLLAELIAAVATEMGIPSDLADTLARQTAYGAGRAATESDLSLEALRDSVTSPGGTTAAALASFEESGIRAIVGRALRAARDRSIELGRG